MAPHDLGTCGASVASSSSSVRSSSRRSLRGPAGDAPTSSPPSSGATPNIENQDCGNEAAGQRRRDRALKLRQTRNRNAARPQGDMSAEDSDDEEEDVKPELSSLCGGEAMSPGTDKQAWKKQQRMIRNRESAALSRKRKRDRIEFLEQQVAGLVDENRGLKHRLAKYEASPQQARYKYARQTAASAAPRPGPVDGDGMKQHNWPTAKPTAVGRKRQAGGAGVAPFDGRSNGHGNGKPTTAHGLNATIAGADRRRTSARQSARRTAARSQSGSAPTAPRPGLPPGLPPPSPPANSSSSVQQASSSPFSYSARLAVTPETAPAAAVALPRSLVLPSLRAVKVELSCSSSSSSSDYDDDDDERIAGPPPAVVLDGYSSCSTLEDLSSAVEPQDCAVKEVGGLQQQEQRQQQMVAFDRDDDAACDNLLLDILSGDGQGQDGDDGFFSLLADDMIVDPSSSETSPEPTLQGLNCFVKEETGF